MTDALTIGFDIGGTNLRAAVVRADGSIIDRRATPTPTTPSGLEAGIDDIVTDLRNHHEIKAVGLSVAGFLDENRHILRFAPHLPWRTIALADHLQHRLGLPVEMEHDANSAGWAEHLYGAARGADDWVLLAIGTGIGVAHIADGRIQRGAFGTAPELGHLTVVPGGRPCPCGKRGCLERYCSGTALITTEVELFGDNQYADGAEIFRAARREERRAVTVIKHFSTWCAQALGMVSDIFDPELIVLGGGVGAQADLYLDQALSLRPQYVTGAAYRRLPDVVPATLGPDAGMIGAAAVAAGSLDL
ncbi:ROK family protein [Corynebacterium ulceribovis]|uniref:ROK family protein n=1 Tax=Corynebacterium ulceribovis TaxID=487732 RepID=UPI000377FC11|nr:ROK family protein [Corynebacterium ulceribovis]